MALTASSTAITLTELNLKQHRMQFVGGFNSRIVDGGAADVNYEVWYDGTSDVLYWKVTRDI